MALSKDWTLERLRGLLRSITNEISEDDAQTLVLDDIIHLCVLEVSDLLLQANYPEYGKVERNLAASSDALDISSLRVNRLEKVIDKTNGLALISGSLDFEDIELRPQYQNNIHYYWYGQEILLRKGENLANYGAFDVYYIRVPDRANEDSDFIDISDRFMTLLVDKAKWIIYETLKATPPDGLKKGIDLKVDAILKSNVGVSD